MREDHRPRIANPVVELDATLGRVRLEVGRDIANAKTAICTADSWISPAISPERTPTATTDERRRRDACRILGMLLRDRTVLVTGGASGLGGATVDMVVAAGGRAVVISTSTPTRGAARAAAHGDRARFVQADVTRGRTSAARSHEAPAAFGEIDGLVNAAGIPTAERVLGQEGVQPLGALRARRSGQPDRHLQRDRGSRPSRHGREHARARPASAA